MTCVRCAIFVWFKILRWSAADVVCFHSPIGGCISLGCWKVTRRKTTRCVYQCAPLYLALCVFQNLSECRVWGCHLVFRNASFVLICELEMPVFTLWVILLCLYDVASTRMCVRVCVCVTSAEAKSRKLGHGGHLCPMTTTLVHKCRANRKSFLQRQRCWFKCHYRTISSRDAFEPRGAQ